MKRNQRRYSLFEKVGDKWERLTTKSYFRQTAIMVWQDELLAPVLAPQHVRGLRELRPVKF